MTPLASPRISIGRSVQPAARPKPFVCVLFPLFFVGSFLVGTTRFASWGSVSFFSVCVERQETQGRFYDVAGIPEYDATVI